MSGSRSLRQRIAGQSAMSDVVLAHSLAPQRGRLARLFGFSPLPPESRIAYTGALGELLVGDVLENLGVTWDVLHDLPLGPDPEGGEQVLDHLVIGPGGIYAVHVINLSDKDVVVAEDHLLVGGETNDGIQLVKDAGESVAALLSAAAGEPLRVRPVLVVVEPRRLSVRVAARGVRVIPSYQLERFMLRAPRTLSGDEVARISDLADLASTWPDAAPPSLDVLNLHRQFAVVRNEMRQALVRRVLWGTLGIAVLYGTVWALIASLVSMMVASR